MRRMLLAVSLTVLVPAVAAAQVREALVILKDGFTIKGKAIQQKDFETDPFTGQSFTIPKAGSVLYLDDDVRRFRFSPSQVQEVIVSKPGETRKDMIRIVKGNVTNRTNHIQQHWKFDQGTPWNDRWERTIGVTTERGSFEMRQKIILMTPWQTYIMNMDYDWDQQFLTKELDPNLVVTLLRKHYAAKKEMKEADRRLLIATFLYQAEWYGFALLELERLVKDLPEAKEKAEPLINQLKQMRINLFVEDLERTHRIGQHTEAQTRIDAYYKEDLGKMAGEKQQIIVQDLKAKYDAAKEKIQQAKHALKELPMKLNGGGRPFWLIAAATITEELTIDTLPRLETFLTFAQQHLRELEEKRKPAQATEELLAIAVSGWLQGSNLAEPDAKNAVRLFKARLMLQEYLKTDGNLARTQLLGTFNREHDLPVDVMARLIRMMPPITPLDKVGTEQIKLDIEAPGADDGTYLVQLPPDYNHYRSYPVVVLLQSPREKAEILVQRWREVAAYHGYILAAPLWGGKNKQFSYKYSAREHALVLDTLRDLRRRFNVDSDRVFLFGWEDGGTMAFDVGLSHPHEFAGVLPMNGSSAKFPQRYGANAQYLPFYVVEGDHNGNHMKNNAALFKDWLRGNYPVLGVEYKGRASEWFGWELPPMFDWMNRKKRHQPVRELGRYHTAGGSGDEFRTLRETDNKFYWLGTSSINERNLTDAVNFQNVVRPATLQANIGIGNEGDSKRARIWSQINIRTSGVKQVTVWLAPNMIDFTKPVVIRVNSNQYGNQRTVTPSLPTMLEEYLRSGDKQRLYYAKIELKL